MTTVHDAYAKHFSPGKSPTNWEVWSWFFMRVSGLLLVFLLLGHMAVMHIFGGGVEQIDYDFVVKRWGNVFWRSYDWLLLALALTHGANGARIVLEDHIRRNSARVFLKGSLYAITFIFFALGSLVIFTFDISQMPGG